VASLPRSALFSFMSPSFAARTLANLKQA